MKISKEQEEKLILLIQAILGISVIVLSVINSSNIQTKQMKKVMAKHAKQTGKLYQIEYKQKKRALSQKYGSIFSKK